MFLPHNVLVHAAQALSTALATVLVLGAAAPVQAQAIPIGNGGGTYVGSTPEMREFAFHVAELPNGTVQGHGIVNIPAAAAQVRFDITSYMFVGGALLMAGPISAVRGAPEVFAVGATFFFAVQDHGEGDDETTGLSVVPAMFGNLTIQQIVALIGPPPPQTFETLTAGDIRIH